MFNFMYHLSRKGGQNLAREYDEQYIGTTVQMQLFSSQSLCAKQRAAFK